MVSLAVGKLKCIRAGKCKVQSTHIWLKFTLAVQKFHIGHTKPGVSIYNLDGLLHSLPIVFGLDASTSCIGDYGLRIEQKMLLFPVMPSNERVNSKQGGKARGRGNKERQRGGKKIPVERCFMLL